MKEEVKRLYSIGYSYSKISNIYRINLFEIYKILNDTSGKDEKEILKDAIITLYNKSYSVKRIASDCNIDFIELHNIIRRYEKLGFVKTRKVVNK